MSLTATILPKTDSLIRLGVNCPFCGFPFHPGDHVVFCPNDNTPHHAACWQQNGNHCTLLGCTGAGEVVVPTAPPPPAKTSCAPFVIGSIATLAFVALIIGLVNWGILSFDSGSLVIRLFASPPTPAPTVPPPTRVPVLTFTPTTMSTPTRAAIPTSTLTALPTRLTDARGVPMVLVPAGEFTMGSDPDVALAECKKLYIGRDCKREWFEDEYPPHPVNLSAFYIDQYEVTNEQFAKFLNDKGNQSEDGATWLDAADSDVRIHQVGGVWQADSGYAKHPVIEVTWYGARAFCQWRGNNARLPTEAEWEKAARGTDGRLYPWGNMFDGRRVNFCDRNCILPWANKDYDDGYADTAPAGTYANGASPYGAMDMAGNVWEWVADWYDEKYYANSPRNNPTGPSSGQYRILRGGAWLDGGSGVRAAGRSSGTPTVTDSSVGFRCARSP